jgi:hypothetical protein
MTEGQEKSECKCPYCDKPVDPRPPFCKPCDKEFEICDICGKPVPKGADFCPHCNPES